MDTGTANWHSQKQYLKENWNSLTGDLGEEQLKEDLFEEILQHYSSSKRYYHSVEHIANLLQQAHQFESRLYSPHTVRFSIFYHDIIYVAGRKDNELKSAVLAAEAMKKMGMGPDMIRDVEHYILATANHHAYTGNNPDLKYFLDFDLSILAAGRQEYEQYAMNVRKEFSHVPGFLYKQGRAAFLRQMLGQHELFFTGEFRLRDAVARENLEWELREGLKKV